MVWLARVVGSDGEPVGPGSVSQNDARIIARLFVRQPIRENQRRQRVCRVELGPVLAGESHVGQDVVVAVIHGRPVCSQLWLGNAANATSLVPVVDRLSRRFAIRCIGIVAEREARTLYILGVPDDPACLCRSP